MVKEIKISCLPVAGIENPYQQLMMEGLRTNPRLKVCNGIHDRFFGILRTAHVQRPNYIHFDWETSYYYRKSLWMTLVNVPSFILQVYLAKFFYGSRLVWTPHNITPHDSKHKWIHKFCRRFFARQMDWIRLFSEESIGRGVKEFKIPSNKFVVVPEGSYVGYYPNEVQQLDAKKKLGLPLNKRVLLFIGLIKPYKGILKLIHAFKELDFQDTILVIAGKPINKEFSKEVKDNCNESIIFHDKFVDVKNVQFYLKN